MGIHEIPAFGIFFFFFLKWGNEMAFFVNEIEKVLYQDMTSTFLYRCKLTIPCSNG